MINQRLLAVALLAGAAATSVFAQPADRQLRDERVEEDALAEHGTQCELR